MSCPEELSNSLRAGIGDNDAPATESDRFDFLLQRLSYERGLLQQKSPNAGDESSRLLSMPDWRLVQDAFDHVIALLRSGRATIDIQNLIADFLTLHVDAKGENAARAILGVPLTIRRPHKRYERDQAVIAYELALERGESQDEAELAAWEEYSPDKPHATLAKRRLNKGDCGYENEAERFMDTTIRPLLRSAKVLKPRKAGRPKAGKSTPKVSD